MSAAKSTPAIERFKAFPAAPAPNDDPRTVKSNLTEEQVRLLQNVFAHHIAHHPDSRVFGHEQVRGLKLVEITVTAKNAPGQKGKETQTRASRPDDFEGVTVCELTVQEGKLVDRAIASGRRLIMPDRVHRDAERARDARWCVCDARHRPVSPTLPMLTSVLRGCSPCARTGRHSRRYSPCPH